MEIHHHPHHEHNPEHKKKWTEYLFEFFMLFIAVSAGFFMENLREHFVENTRAKEYAKSLYSDLQKDTAAISAAIKFSKGKMTLIDSLVKISHMPQKSWNDTAFVKLFSGASIVQPFEPTESTYEQIKSSGSLRYFNQDLVNLLNAYDIQAKKVVKREDIDLKYTVEQYLPFTIQFANMEAGIQIRFNQPLTVPITYKKDNASIQMLVNDVLLIKGLRMRTMQEYEILLKDADDLISAIEEKYDVEK